MEPFGWTDKYSLKVHIGIGIAFLAFAGLTAVSIAFDIGKGIGAGLWAIPLFAVVAGSIVLWRAKDRIERRNR